MQSVTSHPWYAYFVLLRFTRVRRLHQRDPAISHAGSTTAAIVSANTMSLLDMMESAKAVAEEHQASVAQAVRADERAIAEDPESLVLAMKLQDQAREEVRNSLPA